MSKLLWCLENAPNKLVKEAERFYNKNKYIADAMSEEYSDYMLQKLHLSSVYNLCNSVLDVYSSRKDTLTSEDVIFMCKLLSVNRLFNNSDLLGTLQQDPYLRQTSKMFLPKPYDNIVIDAVIDVLYSKTDEELTTCAILQRSYNIKEIILLAISPLLGVTFPSEHALSKFIEPATRMRNVDLITCYWAFAQGNWSSDAIEQLVNKHYDIKTFCDYLNQIGYNSSYGNSYFEHLNDLRMNRLFHAIA